MQLSILIPTLASRQAGFQRIVQKLKREMTEDGELGEFEILDYADHREHTLGFKRNALMARARGEFIAFVDDDDDVSDEYIRSIHRALLEHPNVDCVGIAGLVYFRGVRPHRFVYSRQYDHYFSRGGVYYRPPYVLNPIRREIACQFPFEPANSGEDIDWAMRMARAGVLQREHLIDSNLYFYYSRRHWQTQWLIDATEPVRHPLGLQLANRLRVARWARERLNIGAQER